SFTSHQEFDPPGQRLAAACFPLRRPHKLRPADHYPSSPPRVLAEDHRHATPQVLFRHRGTTRLEFESGPTDSATCPTFHLHDFCFVRVRCTLPIIKWCGSTVSFRGRVFFGILEARSSCPF